MSAPCLIEFKRIWRAVRKHCKDGYCISELGLQALLLLELRSAFQDHVLVEPTWTLGPNPAFPDIVLITDERITDIFELKFMPHYFPDLRYDIKKLISYKAN